MNFVDYRHWNRSCLKNSSDFCKFCKSIFFLALFLFSFSSSSCVSIPKQNYEKIVSVRSCVVKSLESYIETYCDEEILTEDEINEIAFSVSQKTAFSDEINSECVYKLLLAEIDSYSFFNPSLYGSFSDFTFEFFIDFCLHDE